METAPARPDRAPLSGLERAVVVLDVLLGLALCVIAADLLAIYVGNGMEASDPHGGVFGLLGAVLLGPPGILFFVAALGVARRWRGRWWLHLLPPLFPTAFLILGDAGLLS